MRDMCKGQPAEAACPDEMQVIDKCKKPGWCFAVGGSEEEMSERCQSPEDCHEHGVVSGDRL